MNFDINTGYWATQGLIHMQTPWSSAFDEVNDIKGTFLSVDIAAFKGGFVSSQGVGQVEFQIPQY